MELTIQNNLLTIVAETRGAQLKQIRGADQTEYLWQGDDRFWPDRAPILFPYVARLTNGQYLYKGKRYSMPIHGFASQMEFHPEQVSQTEMRFHLYSTEETRAIYPFPFHFVVTYRLEGNCLTQIYSVTNEGTEDMYFGIGSHHGFNVPLIPQHSFGDYSLVFHPNVSPIHVGFSEDCFPTGEDTPFPLDNGTLPLNHNLFDNDAIVLRNAGDTVRLQSEKTAHSITADLQQIPFLSLWHTPRTEAPFLCIEAWCSLPSRKGILEDIETQPTLHRLSPAEQYTSELRFTFT